MIKEIIKRTLRVPEVAGDAGDGSTIVRQLDVVLMNSGFKLSKDLIEQLSGLHASYVKAAAEDILIAVKELIGDHVKHNVYFKKFPDDVPDTLEFWTDCILDAMMTPGSRERVLTTLATTGVINLLDLPKYGKYLHTYEEMLEAHEEFIKSSKDRVTLLHLGGSIAEETQKLYFSLAESTVPLNEGDRELLKELTELCLLDEHPAKIPVRENKAIVNSVLIKNGYEIDVDTPTDILRLACALSDGDVTLVEKTKFRSFPRTIRRDLLSALNVVINECEDKLQDVTPYRERWKRLAVGLHPFEYGDISGAHEVFAVAVGDRKAQTLAGKVEEAFRKEDIPGAIKLMETRPGMLLRNVDRTIRMSTATQMTKLAKAVKKVVPNVSSRVILALIQHLNNRVTPKLSRIFANSKGTVWSMHELREVIDTKKVDKIVTVLTGEIADRLPVFEHLVIDPVIEDIALPLSEKNKATGFNILPRGSIAKVDGSTLRFFMYWKQKAHRTDLDLSALLLDSEFEKVDHISYTNLKSYGAVHSGDITNAPNGASEFIDVELDKVPCKYIVPMVLRYAGEDFAKTEESFFGYMERSRDQKGKPFEAATVRTKSDLRGDNKVALPLIFFKENGNWFAKWLHIFVKGAPQFNRIEENTKSSARFTIATIEKDFLTMKYLTELLEEKAENVYVYEEDVEFDEPVTFIGLETPEGLPEESKVFNLSNLHELII